MAKSAETEQIKERAHILIQGVVQGVGFRPFIYRLANQYGLAGWIYNFSGGVEIEIEGDAGDVRQFIRDIPLQKPVLALISKMEIEKLPPAGYRDFSIRESQKEEGEFSLISPDMAPCPDCLRELYDPADRRYRYPFLNCTNCGPRYTIIKSLPYDRPSTTMAAFPMCHDCEREYKDVADRRYHAQPVACPACGPRLYFIEDGRLNEGEPLKRAVSSLKAGKIVAVKGVGGFHLACDAQNPEAVERLRLRKGREGKPFALMAASIAAAEEFVHLSEREREVLSSPRRPIVLLRKKEGSLIAPNVAPGLKEFGVMLPYTPLHYLLLEDFRALVMTSGNPTSEPLTVSNAEALERLNGIADCFLLHNRDIFVPCDDSVVRVVEGVEVVIRRGRGYAPLPVVLPNSSGEVLGCGGESKNAFCFTRGNFAFLSEHIGDMINPRTCERFRDGVDYYEKAFKLKPQVIACDPHPRYFATLYAKEITKNPEFIQHHHAHLVACMAENGIDEPCIGIALDGTGWGEDGTIWGSEYGIVDLKEFRRRAHLEYLPLPGGDKAVEEPWRVALSLLHLTYGEKAEELPLSIFRKLNKEEKAVVFHLLRHKINSPLSAGAGRLFEGISALLGIAMRNTYEGEAAALLEGAVDEGIEASYPYFIREEKLYVIDPRPIVRGVVDDLANGVSLGRIAAKFHNTVGEFTIDVCRRLFRETGLLKAVLSGGCFQNRYLLLRILSLLRRDGFTPYFHSQVPPNDGGIALGQAVAAWERRKNSVPCGSR